MTNKTLKHPQTTKAPTPWKSTLQPGPQPGRCYKRGNHPREKKLWVELKGWGRPYQRPTMTFSALLLLCQWKTLSHPTAKSNSWTETQTLKLWTPIRTQPFETLSWWWSYQETKLVKKNPVVSWYPNPFKHSQNPLSNRGPLCQWQSLSSCCRVGKNKLRKGWGGPSGVLPKTKHWNSLLCSPLPVEGTLSPCCQIQKLEENPNSTVNPHKNTTIWNTELVVVLPRTKTSKKNPVFSWYPNPFKHSQNPLSNRGPLCQWQSLSSCCRVGKNKLRKGWGGPSGVLPKTKHWNSLLCCQIQKAEENPNSTVNPHKNTTIWNTDFGGVGPRTKTSKKNPVFSGYPNPLNTHRTLSLPQPTEAPPASDRAYHPAARSSACCSPYVRFLFCMIGGEGSTTTKYGSYALPAVPPIWNIHETHNCPSQV